jgi:hypothetical protein
MQTAILLSDLKSLAVCPPEAALKLVNIHKTLDEAKDQKMDALRDQVHGGSQPDAADNLEGQGNDLQRATELISLHYEVKVRHQQGGLDGQVLQAREDVANVLSQLATRSQRGQP